MITTRPSPAPSQVTVMVVACPQRSLPMARDVSVTCGRRQTAVMTVGWSSQLQVQCAVKVPALGPLLRSRRYRTTVGAPVIVLEGPRWWPGGAAIRAALALPAQATTVSPSKGGLVLTAVVESVFSGLSMQIVSESSVGI